MICLNFINKSLDDNGDIYKSTNNIDGSGRHEYMELVKDALENRGDTNGEDHMEAKIQKPCGSTRLDMYEPLPEQNH